MSKSRRNVRFQRRSNSIGENRRQSISSDISDAPSDPSNVNAANVVANGGDGNSVSAPSTIPEEVGLKPMRSCAGGYLLTIDADIEIRKASIVRL